MSSAAIHHWAGGALTPVDYCDTGEHVVDVADSFLIAEGTAFALSLHENRFFEGVSQRGPDLEGFAALDVEGFWAAALDSVPTTGGWFPRVELQSRNGVAHLVYRHREAPALSRSVILTNHTGPDPRRVPRLKGPDLAALVAVRTRAQQLGADDAVILTDDGYIVDGATSAIVWWRGDILCAPPTGDDDPQFDRVDSVTVRSLFGLASALGVDTYREAVTPAELDGCEVWALGALHGIRLATTWLNGPELAELPGRLALWRDRREALRKPLPEKTPTKPSL